MPLTFLAFRFGANYNGGQEKRRCIWPEERPPRDKQTVAKRPLDYSRAQVALPGPWVTAA